jgi:hypothetical protein
VVLLFLFFFFGRRCIHFRRCLGRPLRVEAGASGERAFQSISSTLFLPRHVTCAAMLGVIVNATGTTCASTLHVLQSDPACNRHVNDIVVWFVMDKWDVGMPKRTGPRDKNDTMRCTLSHTAPKFA